LHTVAILSAVYSPCYNDLLAFLLIIAIDDIKDGTRLNEVLIAPIRVNTNHNIAYTWTETSKFGPNR